MLAPQDIVAYKNISCPDELLKEIKIIANHTKNTWQTNRTLESIISDTKIGKIAEFTLKNHIKQYSNYDILDYDDFRVNNYEKHAHLDCIIFQKQNTQIDNAITQINLDTTNSLSGALSQNTKDLLRQSQIHTMEIKSTRITNRHKNNSEISFDKIINDDFLAYPKFARKISSHIQINSWEQYHNFCIENHKISPNIDLITLKNIEFENMYDFYARIYVEQLDLNVFDIYLIGYITKQDFIEKSTIKRMPQYQKSEQSLYIATKLKNGVKFKQ